MIEFGADQAQYLLRFCIYTPQGNRFKDRQRTTRLAAVDLFGLMRMPQGDRPFCLVCLLQVVRRRGIFTTLGPDLGSLGMILFPRFDR